MKKVYACPHTHWDREWYFNTSRSTIYLIKHIKEVIDVLEKREDYPPYILDAQISLLNDYFAFYPEDYERIKKLVSQKKLLTGPWVTQTDQLVISQESVVRNLFYGTQAAEKLGYYMKVGYAPDIFGQGGNMPQIYKNFGIDRAVFWRGVSDNTLNDTEFIWEGTDGTQILAHIMRKGYNFGGKFGIPSEGEENKKQYIKTFIDNLDDMTSRDIIYFPVGFDQSPILENFPELIEGLNEFDKEREYVTGSPEDYFDELKKEDLKSFSVIKGELTEGKHSRVHKSIFSTRADMKILNNSIENLIVNTLEPISVISHSLGFDYPHAEIKKIWNIMFENAAHDSIGGCNSDSTNRDIIQRYKIAKDLTLNLIELTMRKISSKIKSDKELNLVLFNQLPYPRKGVIEAEAYVPFLDFYIKNDKGEILEHVIEKEEDVSNYVLGQILKIDSSREIYIPEKVYKVKMKIFVPELISFGYENLYIDKDNKSGIVEKSKENTKDFIENEYYKVSLNKNNTVDIFNKTSNELYEEQLIFADTGDDGDSYNFSPPRNDMEIVSKDSELKSKKILINDVEESMFLILEMKVPSDLKERELKNADKKMEIKVGISLRKAEKLIRFNVKINNEVKSHKVTVRFKTGIENKHSIADHLFGQIQRPVRYNTMDVWEKENWNEMPITIEPMQSYAGVSNEKKCQIIYTENVREYEITGENYDTLQLTLFRTFGYLGKKDLLYRPGRSSGESVIETPDAQLQKELEFNFAVGYYENPIDEINVSKISKEYLSPIQSYQFSDFLHGRIIFAQKPVNKEFSKKYSLYDLQADDLGISAIKKSEYEDEYLIRIFNPYKNKDVSIPEKLLKNRKVKLDEKNVDKNGNEKLSTNKFTTIIL